MFLDSLNYFRAIAIIFIVAGHSFKVSEVTYLTISEHTIKNIVSGGTSLFVFISGFLFHHIFYKGYQYKNFYLGKLKNLLPPYLLLSILPVTYYVITKDNHFDGFFLAQGSGFFSEYIEPAVKYLWTGRFLTAYWYIPFILITFLMSPIHVLFIKLRLNIQIPIIVLFTIISLLIHRPYENLYVFHSVLYFFPVYLIGILCSINKQIIYDKLGGKELYLLAVVIGIASFDSFLNLNIGLDESAYPDIVLLQKITLCIFFMVWLHRFEDTKSRFLHILASTSFAVFFIHPYVLTVLSVIKKHFNLQIAEPWIVFVVVIIFVMAISVVTAILTRKIFSRYSKYIIGY